MKKTIDFLKKQPLLTAIIAVVFAIFGIKLLSSDNNFGLGIHRFMLAFAMFPFLYIISGEKTFQKSEKTTGYVFKTLFGLLVFAIFLCSFGVIYSIVEKFALADDCVIATLMLLFAMLGVGLFEEMTFRAVVNDGFIYQFRDKKWVFAVSAILGSLLFGYVHVMTDTVTNLLTLAQVVLKTVSTGMFGMCLLFLYWKTRNIWGCAIVHGVYDFLLSVNDTVFVNPEKQEISYVNEGVMGGTAVGIYIVEIVVVGIIMIILYHKVLKTIDFEELRKNW